MATGPEHYRAAEHAIENAKYEEGNSARERFFLDVALIHATLAQAAATAMAGAPGGMNPIDLEEWDGVCGAQEPDEDEPCARCGDYGHEVGDCEAVLDDEQAGAEIDAAVESTGHLPGYGDGGAR